jgi:hypothetical protein
MPTRAHLPFLPLAVQWGRPVGASAYYALTRLCRYPVGPACQSLRPPSTARLHGPRASTPRCHLALNRHPDPLYKSPHTPLPPCLAHFTSAHSPKLRAPVLQARRSFPVARPSASDSSPVELARRPRSCSATVTPSLSLVPAPPEVNLFAGPSLLSPPSSLFCRLVTGDRRYRFRTVESRPPCQPRPPHAFFAHAESPAPAMALAPCALPR